MNRLAEEFLVNAAEDLDADFVEMIRREGIIQVLQNFNKNIVPHFQLLALVRRKERARYTTFGAAERAG